MVLQVFFMSVEGSSELFRVLHDRSRLSILSLGFFRVPLGFKFIHYCSQFFRVFHHCFKFSGFFRALQCGSRSGFFRFGNLPEEP